MTIAALITEGIGPGSAIKFVLTGGLDLGAVPTVTVDTHDGIDHIPRHPKRVLDELRRRREQQLEERAALRRELEIISGLRVPEPAAAREPAVTAPTPPESAIVVPLTAVADPGILARARAVELQIVGIDRELEQIAQRIHAARIRRRTVRRREEEQIILLVLGLYDD